MTGKDLLEEAKAAYPGSSDKHLFEVQMPYALALSNEVLNEKFDAIVVDEAQDFSDEYWFAIEELMRDQDTGYLRWVTSLDTPPAELAAAAIASLPLKSAATVLMYGHLE